jgi:hypothetical protein
MATIIPFRQDQNVFDPKDIAAMSAALDDLTKMLKPPHDSRARAIMAARIVELARSGERDAKRLRNRVLQETNMAERAGLGGPHSGVKWA